jgi:hypothetical protein
VRKSDRPTRIRVKRGLNATDNLQTPRNWKHYLFVLGIFFLVFAIPYIYTFKPKRHTIEFTSLATNNKIIPKNSTLSGTEFGQFPPSTESELELERMLRGKDEDIDLALANWLVAADVPQFRDMTRQKYFVQLDDMVAQVRQDMERMKKVAESRGKGPNDPNTLCGIFCNAIIKLQFAYAEELRQETLTPALMKGLYSDADNIFLAGLFRTHRGSCVSMPLIYIVIGRRLGLPVHLVAIGRHYFIRWEEPRYRMNIESTIVDRVSVTPDDSVYLDIEGMTRKQVIGSDLRNLTSREVMGNLFFARSAYWATKGPEHKIQQCLDLSRARHLSPDDSGIKASHEAIFDFYSIKPEDKSLNIKPKNIKNL